VLYESYRKSEAVAAAKLGVPTNTVTRITLCNPDGRKVPEGRKYLRSVSFFYTAARFVTGMQYGYIQRPLIGIMNYCAEPTADPIIRSPSAMTILSNSRCEHHTEN
jgi:hypothetical protein